MPKLLSQDFSTKTEPPKENIGFRQQMKNMFTTYFFPASVVYGTSYAGLLGAIYLGLSFNVGAVVGFDYPTVLQQVQSGSSPQDD
jgi:hypothetical protein